MSRLFLMDTLRSLLSVLLLSAFPLHSTAPAVPVPFETVAITSPLAAQAVIPPHESLSPAIEATLDRRLSASGVIIMDLESAQVLYERRADTPLPMASLTKLMTALLIVENHTLDETVTVPSDLGPNGNMVRLPKGDTFTVGDLLTSLLVSSSNDAAITLARYHSGSASAFIQAMNDRAASLGLRDTSFTNPVGFDHPLQYASPKDLAWLTMYVWKEPAIRERMGLKTVTIQSQEGTSMALTHTHTLLQSEPSIIAGKTGTTNGAGECLLSLVEKDGHIKIVILQGSENRYRDMKEILQVLTPPIPPVARSVSDRPETSGDRPSS